ncbi:conserved hypothetical protein [Trichormus variabilis ATCC 29413]|uniref:DUF4350 domain-containing protein n=2 Tax=Anabaena variabilis TaxID=264691 RepID=Q3MAS6_TRIV2|nr:MULTISPECIES: DUF4350 domain-containing protein [Nostocaceae]ABA21910.1 conserved hypothetical protein [Trichormus variabilis ATCC 29413]MBC1213393.1 DUF4350 domain-containing protein [Trichormus variabilis ARAD]MBC1255093.1 DUF4350 domain-containing protein [Trichormus variabilis V5]MBC1268845.1 DUF4350 domain-containing protein [Trichormus variabilis FSR]MBC1302385.1 DUF4350 domain-containing protein [Trichormus variabilis N2B]
MKRSNRVAWLGAIALGVIIILSFIAAPNTQINSGSTYNRAADGYGAWYAFMQKQGITIQRWQKPLSQLNNEKEPATVLRVYGYLRQPQLDRDEEKWLEKGNNLVILGVRTRVSAANFQTMQPSPVGEVKIDTRRRFQKAKQSGILLGDRFGAVVWEEKREKGQVIFATTPYLAANAYQDNLSNFQYLASLVNQKNNTLFVDEYIHGYKDADVKESEGQGDLISYFAQTPMIVILVQAGVLLLVLIWGQNHRFGKPIALNTPVIDNSQAYIQALAGVLHKAESSEFVVEMVGKEEQLQLQKALGLGSVLLEPETLVNIWAEKTGKSATELDAVLKPQYRKRRLSERELLNWLLKWRSLRVGS